MWQHKCNQFNKNPILCSCIKHIKITHHFFHDHVKHSGWYNLNPSQSNWRSSIESLMICWTLKWIEHEDKDLLLLYDLPRSYEYLNDTMLYGKEGIVTLEEFQATLRTKELTKLRGLKVDDSSEGLSVSRGKYGSKGNHGNSKGCNKSKYKCFKLHKTNHFKKDCLEYRAMMNSCNFQLP